MHTDTAGYHTPCLQCGYVAGAVRPGRILKLARVGRGLSAPALLSQSGVDKDDSWLYALERSGGSVVGLGARPVWGALCSALGIDLHFVVAGDADKTWESADPALPPLDEVVGRAG